MRKEYRLRQKSNLTWRIFGIDCLLSLFLTFCTTAFCLIVGLITAIFDDFSTNILQLMFVAMPFIIVAIFILALLSELNDNFKLKKETIKEK